MKQGKLYWHEFTKGKGYIIILCTENSPKNSDTFSGVVVKTRQVTDEIGDYSKHWGIKMFKEFNGSINIRKTRLG
jgi:hypothetical protein